MYHHILFDLDGTIVDSGEGIIASAKYTMSQMGIDDNDESKLKQFVGPPLVSTFQSVYQFSEERAHMAAKIFREYYDKKGKYQCVLYEGIKEVLAQLCNEKRTLMIATSKPTNFANDITDYLEITSYFHDIVGSNLDNTRSKKSDILDYIAEKYHVVKPETVMIGDTVHDKIGAEQAGIPFIGVSYGYGFQNGESIPAAMRMVKTPIELLDFID